MRNHVICSSNPPVFPMLKSPYLPPSDPSPEAQAAGPSPYLRASNDHGAAALAQWKKMQCLAAGDWLALVGVKQS